MTRILSCPSLFSRYFSSQEIITAPFAFERLCDRSMFSTWFSVDHTTSVSTRGNNNHNIEQKTCWFIDYTSSNCIYMVLDMSYCLLLSQNTANKRDQVIHVHSI